MAQAQMKQGIPPRISVPRVKFKSLEGGATKLAQPSDRELGELDQRVGRMDKEAPVYAQDEARFYLGLSLLAVIAVTAVFFMFMSSMPVTDAQIRALTPVETTAEPEF